MSSSKTAVRRKRIGAAIPGRTLAGFVTAVLAVVAMASFSFWSLAEGARSAARVTQTLEAVSQLQALLSSIKDAETGQRGYLLTGAESYLDPFAAAERALPTEVAQAHRALADKADQLRRLELVEQLASEKLAELRGTIELRRAGKTNEALDVVRTNRGRDIMKRLRAVTAEMMANEQGDLETRNQSYARASSFSMLVTVGGSALLLVLIILAANMSARDFAEQAAQAWLRTGQSELSVELQGEQSMATLGGAVAGFLAKYLDAQLAAVYFAPRRTEPELIGSWGLAAGAEAARASAGGLTGQTLKDNRLLHVRDVPEDYFAVRSGIGEHRPRELVVAPVTVDGTPNGVIELGFFRALEPAEVEFLRLIADAIGTAFRSAKYRTDVQRLLEETQRQSEELQTQQEELRVSNEELEQQTRTLEESQARLLNQQAELEEINAQLEEQTQSLEKQRADLARAQVELERASAYKSEFLANMSHELRTPLNSSLILAKLLVDNRGGNLTEEQVKFARTIYSAGNDLLTLINDILDLSRIEAGKLDVRPESLPLARVVEELSNSFQPVAKDRGLTFDITVEEGLPKAIFTDPVRLQQILKNLLSNAFKFTERGGVSLSVRRVQGKNLAFDVKDTGIGIAPEQHEVIFEAFRQADGTTNRKYGGTGLGLSISRDLSRLLGGELSLTSAPGNGSTFTLVLPEEYAEAEPARVARSAEPALPRAPRVMNGAAKATNGAVKSANGAIRRTNGVEPQADEALATTPDDREGLTPGSRAILIIEDDLAFARILYDLSHELDFKALIAQTAEAGLFLAERYLPSAIVLDVGLPDRSGLSVLDTLKHSPATRHIPVHMFSVEDHAQTALEMGALGYALKPLRREELFEAFRKLEAKFTQKLRRVLVVEDDETARESTCRLLAGDGVETLGVGTAAAALAALGTSPFDCMVLDLSLPDRSGFELLEEMTGTASAPPPVIVYTGRSLSREEEQSLRRFSTSIIIKGARSPERLLDEVTLFLHQVEADLPADRRRMLKSAREREAVFEGRRVLIVEDDVRNIFALTSVLEPRGAKIEIARNGREAVEHLRDKPGVDLVLMDIMMPEMDGLEAMRKIRERRELARLPIIALTAKAMADDRENCLAAGANDYIAKPVDVDKLLSLARVWMPK